VFTVRPAELKDATNINSTSVHLGYVRLSDALCAKKLEVLLSSNIDIVLVAISERVVIGWLHAFLSRRLASPDYYEIAGLVVAPEYRDKGVGKALVNHVRHTYDGKLRVRCNEKRTGSHQFYQALGFTHKKSQRIYEMD
jgi:GNAT superfamily N-acetyltransferase